MPNHRARIRCLAVMAVLLPAPAVAANGWEPAPFAKEGKRSAQGCALKYHDDAYVCLYVRCDAPGRLGFYIAAPGPDVVGAIRVAIDGTDYPVTILSTPDSPLQFANRAETFPEPLLAAMKTGRQIKLLNSGLKSGFDVIPLKGAGPAISRVEKACKP